MSRNCTLPLSSCKNCSNNQRYSTAVSTYPEFYTVVWRPVPEPTEKALKIRELNKLVENWR